MLLSWADLLLQGFAYVKYNNSISAASAVERYNGFELPAGSGLRLKVGSLLPSGIRLPKDTSTLCLPASTGSPAC